MIRQPAVRVINVSLLLKSWFNYFKCLTIKSKAIVFPCSAKLEMRPSLIKNVVLQWYVGLFEYNIKLLEYINIPRNCRSILKKKISSKTRDLETQLKYTSTRKKGSMTKGTIRNVCIGIKVLHSSEELTTYALRLICYRNCWLIGTLLLVFSWPFCVETVFNWKLTLLNDCWPWFKGCVAFKMARKKLTLLIFVSLLIHGSLAIFPCPFGYQKYLG